MDWKSFKSLACVSSYIIGQFLFIGCGSESVSTLSSDKLVSPVFVLMGGNTTCRDQQNSQTPVGMDMIQELNTLLNSSETRFGAKPKHIVSCYGESSTVYYYLSNDPETVYSGDREQFRDSVRDQLEDDSPLFLIGHSYGGWLAMKTANDLVEDYDISGLYTIDPISRETCSFESPFGCTSAPKDIKTDERNHIRSRTSHWSNFYQSKTWYLHSSKINQAHTNLKLNTSHTSIDTHESVWAQISETVSQRQKQLIAAN